MRKGIFGSIKGGLIFLLLLFMVIFMTSCFTMRMKHYYTDKSNYAAATGTVTHCTYNEDGDALYLAFSNLSEEFDDNHFKIVGDNLRIVQQNGIDEKIAIGDQIDFITAPKYFGDGYVMPIVGLAVDGEELLSFEEGYENLLNWLDE